MENQKVFNKNLSKFNKYRIENFILRKTVDGHEKQKTKEKTCFQMNLSEGPAESEIWTEAEGFIGKVIAGQQTCTEKESTLYYQTITKAEVWKCREFGFGFFIPVVFVMIYVHYRHDSQAAFKLGTSFADKIIEFDRSGKTDH